jgi:hypothetical protein
MDVEWRAKTQVRRPTDNLDQSIMQPNNNT